MSDRDWPEAIDERIIAVATADDPYWAATEIGSAAIHHLTRSRVATSLYLICAELTDRYELNPDEREAAVAAMVQASTEWARAKDDPDARDAYLDHREYGVCGSAPPRLPALHVLTGEAAETTRDRL